MFLSVTVERARDRAKELTGDVAKGENPQATKHDRRAELTLGDLFDYHLEHFGKPFKKTWRQDVAARRVDVRTVSSGVAWAPAVDHQGQRSTVAPHKNRRRQR